MYLVFWSGLNIFVSSIFIFQSAARVFYFFAMYTKGSTHIGKKHCRAFRLYSGIPPSNWNDSWIQ